MSERFILLPEIESKRVLRGETSVLRLFIRETMPEYKVGDILILKEPYMVDGEKVLYLNDLKEWDHGLVYRDIRYKPAILMPKDWCRVRLSCVDVRQEFLQDIDEYCGWYDCGFERLSDFIVYWNEYIGQRYRKDRYWAANPAVYVIRFDRV